MSMNMQVLLPMRGVVLESSRVVPVSGDEIRISAVTFLADDGFPLRGTLYGSRFGEGPVVLVSSAAAVRRAHYGDFAAALIAGGASAVLTYDYRGIGDSVAPGTWQGRVKMKDWGVRDMSAAAALLTRLYPDHPLIGVGQSIGGTMVGLCPEGGRFERYAMVSSAHGHLRHTDEAGKLFVSMNLFALPLGMLLGKVPAWAGIGETVPGPIFRDWARWCRRSGYLFDDPEVPEAEGFARVTSPILSVGATDDPWSTPRATRALLERLPNAPRTELWVSPREAGAERIGHLGFFKRRFAKTLWPPVLSFLVDGRLPAPAA